MGEGNGVMFLDGGLEIEYFSGEKSNEDLWRCLFSRCLLSVIVLGVVFGVGL